MAPRMELQGIILAAGAGSRMSELTNKKAKCLLPVGNKPLIYYPIKALAHTGFLDILIIVPDKHQQEIETEVRGLFSDSRFSFDFFPVSLEEQFGTAESLFLAKDRITTDCIILSCDVVTNYPLLNMINVYRTHDPALVALISTLNPTATTRCFGSSKFERGEKDLVGLDDLVSGPRRGGSQDQQHKRLVFFHSESDFGNSIPFSTDMIKRCKNLTVISHYFDAHVYIFKKAALELLFADRNISSLKGEFVSLLVKKQFDDDILSASLSKDLSLFERTAASFDLGGGSGLYFRPKSLKINCIANIITVSPTSSSSTPNHAPSSGYFCIRANSLPGLLEANKRIAFECSSLSLPPSTPSSTSAPPTQKRNLISSIVSGNNTSVFESAHVIRSVIGANCVIHSSAKISDSFIMDGVIVEEGVVIQATVVCSEARIGKKCSIERCLVSFGYKVHVGSEFTDEFLSDGSETEFLF